MLVLGSRSLGPGISVQQFPSIMGITEDEKVGFSERMSSAPESQELKTKTFSIFLWPYIKWDAKSRSAKIPIF